MKTKRFDFNYKPLQIDICMSVAGSVPGKQNYDADADEYTPDYTLTNLIIQPAISRMDKDEILSAGRINQSLANIKWYEIIGGTRTQIQAENTNYEITTSGGDAGRIKVKKNAQPNLPITLEFYAEYTDTRTNQIIVIRETYQVICNNSTTFIPLLVLDAADQTVYNPFTDQNEQTVHASLRLGTNECAATKRQFVWEKFRDDNTWSVVGTDEAIDYDVTVANDGASVTVDRSKMGAELYLRCRAKYDKNGNPGSVSLTDSAPTKIISFVRRIPKFEYDIGSVPTDIPAGLLAIAPEAKIWDTNGPISNPETQLLPLWLIATNVATGSLNYNQVGHGLSPILPTNAMSQTLGAVIGLDVKDLGPDCAMCDSDGKIFEDSDGKVLLFK